MGKAGAKEISWSSILLILARWQGGGGGGWEAYTLHRRVLNSIRRPRAAIDLIRVEASGPPLSQTRDGGIEMSRRRWAQR